MSEKAVSALWQREYLDDVPNYGVVLTDTGRGVRYVPERTCSLIECEGSTSFYDEYDDGCYYMGCSECGAGMPNDANFCWSCGARVVGE